MESMFKAVKSLFGFKTNEIKKITLGICAMEKKANSKPMTELVKRLNSPEGNLFEIVYFSDDCLLNSPIEQWPKVDALIAFYSKGYPLAKALAYIQLRKPYCVNDLEMESVLADRRKVYALLKQCDVCVPNYVIVNRDDPTNTNEIHEFDEYVEINGVTLNKPLVEKPVDAEDHNIYIYYPMSAGGGSKRLFRKVDNKSSSFHQGVNELRTQGSYIYEEFLTTQGTDVKVYTVGPDYAHAEARKSPVVDGKVNRDLSGFESRYPVILNNQEKEYARNIVNGFRQTVCGFDILRVPRESKSYVCDVNGFSFVKNSKKYYDDASRVLAELLLTNLRHEQWKVTSTRAPLLRYSIGPANSNESSRSPSPLVGAGLDGDRGSSHGSSSSSGGGGPSSPRSRPEKQSKSSSSSSSLSSDPSSEPADEELRCVIAVIRHGDRTPKQKMKIKCSVPEYLEYFHMYAKPEKDLKVKSKSALVKFLEVTRSIISAHMRAFSSGGPQQSILDEGIFRKLRQMKDVLERWEISGINRKLQMKPQKWEMSEDGQKYIKATEILLILKWGGDLTPLGLHQSEIVGTNFRHQMYPDHSGGVLRLHSTYRHDLKIKASDEGRVMKTAAAFAKGLLELEGQLTPILVSLVEVEEKNRQMLDRNGNFLVAEDIERCKKQLDLLQETTEMSLERLEEIAPKAPTSVRDAMMKLNNPRQTLFKMFESIGELCKILREFANAIPQHSLTSLLRPIVDTSVDSEKGSKLSLLNPKGLDDNDGTTPNTNNRTENYTTSTAATVTTNGESPTTPVHSNGSGSKLDEASEVSSNGSSISSQYKLYSHNHAPMSKSISSDSLQSYGDALYLNETYELMCGRWEKLYKDFYSKETDLFDLSKVPDVYDMIRYDCLHNGHLNLKVMEDLYDMAATLENIIVPQEYGTDQSDKLRIGSKMCGALLQKIKSDLQTSHSDHRVDNHYMLDTSHSAEIGVNTLGRHVRTRLYFTSESHIHTLLNELRYPGEGQMCAISAEGQALLDKIPELCYLTQVIFRLFEDRVDPSKFRCEIALSPGANNSPWGPIGSKNQIAPVISLNKSISYEDLMMCLDHSIAAGSPGDDSNSIMQRCDSNVGAPVADSSSVKVSSPANKSKTTVVSSSGFETSDNWENQYQNRRDSIKDRSLSMDKPKESKKEKKEKRSASGGTLADLKSSHESTSNSSSSSSSSGEASDNTANTSTAVSSSIPSAEKSSAVSSLSSSSSSKGAGGPMTMDSD